MNAVFLTNIRNAKLFSVVSITSVLHDIKSCKYKHQIDAVRNSGDYKANKSKLPAWSLNGVFNGSVCNSGFSESNGLFHFDIDNIDDVVEMKKELITSCPELFAVWISPSGKGLKGLLRVPDDLIHDDTEFKKAFEQVKCYFLNDFGIRIDESCKDVRRLCFVCYDCNIYINESATAFMFDVSKWQKIEKPVTLSSPKVYRHDDKYIDYCVNILRRAGAGNYHNARLRAGRLAGGYIAAGVVNESDIVRELLAESDRISSSNRDKNDIVKRERKAILDGVAMGKMSPVNIKFRNLREEFEQWQQPTKISIAEELRAWLNC